MKTILTLLAFFSIAAAAQADTGAGGFQGPDGRSLVTAAEVEGLADDTQVRLLGYIVRKTGDEEYEFKDDSGTLIVEIDDDDWRGVNVSPGDKVQLTGEVDKEWNRTEVEVDSVQLAE
ncbi:MAG TPA: NirD/YgiW/YdeI family stress tolerance protein [Woeseiaceae bacterium]|nr:NirD/YgiW/YdeI family stress tolerance protein [Woeseiaceae bacterium]